ncbi:hypothetical protein BD779DRAFT_1523915 [Infundibulicybe gibba]|nr:hypothetical protein BD779DRAFT_1523915 [Infundibulicybe gibba]
MPDRKTSSPPLTPISYAPPVSQTPFPDSPTLSPTTMTYSPEASPSVGLSSLPPTPSAGAATSSVLALGDELMSTVDDIVGSCPQFRILVLGKSGAGKSSLINAAFNVNLANVSRDRAGVSNIEQEITSDMNPRFILHDSQGFAAGEIENFITVKNFIERRARMPNIKDRLHAIWFCMEIPTENGALFETADQNFLTLDLGDVPLIVVFTKFDLLVSKFEMETEPTYDMDEDQFTALTIAQANEALEELCISRLRDATRGRATPVPFTKVSISDQKQYKNTLMELVELTQKHVDEAVWLIWAFAQRSSAEIKIRASIEVGKRKYWRSLTSSVTFGKRTLKKCLDAIHQDIVRIWNFNDHQRYLESDEFRALMTHLVSDLVDDLGTIPKVQTGMSISTIASIAAIITGIVPPAGLVAIPVAAGLAFAQWVNLMYQSTPSILAGLIGYIVDLTVVMQSLFWLMQSKEEGFPVTPRLILLALAAYEESGTRDSVHRDIRTFVTGTKIFQRGHRDQVLDKVVAMVTAHRFDPPEMYKSRAREIGSGKESVKDGWSAILRRQTGESIRSASSE